MWKRVWKRGRGRRFIRWDFGRRLGENHTPSVMVQFRQHIKSAFYVCYSYAYVIVNIETRLKMVYYKEQSGSPWINTFAVVERWLNEQENKQLNLDNIEWNNTKWVFVKFSNIDVKVVLDRQPLFGTGPLAGWLYNLVHGRTGPREALDTFIEAHKPWESLQIFSTNLKPPQETGQKHLLMNWIRLKDISIRGNSYWSGLVSESLRLSARRMEKWYGILERIHQKCCSQSEFMMGMCFWSRTSIDWQEHMYVMIAKHATKIAFHDKKQRDSITTVQKCSCFDFSEHRWHAWMWAHAYLWHQPKRADPEVYGDLPAVNDTRSHISRHDSCLAHLKQKSQKSSRWCWYSKIRPC